MKRMYYGIAFLVIMVFSCSKDRQVNNTPMNPQLKKAAGLIKVYPGSNDSQAFIDAFEQAKSLGKGTTVKLMPGAFKIGMIEVREFFGKLTGSGKDKTIITNLPGLTPDEDTTANKQPALITFIGGDVTVSDLTLKISDDTIPWLGKMEMSMILFSDYSADFIPAEKHISVNIKNIKVTSNLREFVIASVDSLEMIAPVASFNGIKVAPNLFRMTGPEIKRTRADVTVTNSFFSGFFSGILIWGCKNGNLNFGIDGGNTFDTNVNGLSIHNNFGVNAKVENNLFNVTNLFLAGLDINTGEQYELTDIDFEDVPGDLGTYVVQNNIFNYGQYTRAIGLMDSWRWAHPENPQWINLTIQNNKFQATADVTHMLICINMKNTLITNNEVSGDFTRGKIIVSGMYFLGDHSDSIKYFSEGLRIINNKYNQKNFLIDIKWDTKNCILGGALENVIIDDQGVGTKYTSGSKDGKIETIDKDDLDKIMKRK